MYHNGQVVWNLKDKKPEIHDRLLIGPDTYLCVFFGAIFPKYNQVHFVYVGKEDKYGRPEIACPETVVQALELLEKKVIQPAFIPKSHTQCCGAWDDGRDHAFWCPVKPSKRDPKEIKLHNEIDPEIVKIYNEDTLKGTW